MAACPDGGTARTFDAEEDDHELLLDTFADGRQSWKLDRECLILLKWYGSGGAVTGQCFKREKDFLKTGVSKTRF